MAGTEVVLLPEDDGSVGKVAVQGPDGTVLLTQPFEQTRAVTGRTPDAPNVVDRNLIAERFNDLLRFQAETGFGHNGDLRDLFDISGRFDPADGSVDTASAAADLVQRAGGSGTFSTASTSFLTDEKDEDDDDQSSSGTPAVEVDVDAAPVYELAADLTGAQHFVFDEESLGALLAQAFGVAPGRFFKFFSDFRAGPGKADDVEQDLGFDELLNGDGGGGRFSGGLGNDTISAGAGDDTLIGGPGADVLNGGPGIDLAEFIGSPAGIIVNLATGAASGGDAQGDTFSSIENILGSPFADQITGDAGPNGIEGGGGNDTLDGGGGEDTLIFKRAPSAVTVDLSAGTVTGGAGTLTIQNFENVEGSEFDDRIRGDAAANRLDGDNGADTLFGADGNDTLRGQDGSDSLQGDAGTDSLEGNGGQDTLSGGSANDTLLGGSGNDLLNGDADNDLLNGGAGADQLQGGAGTDTVTYADATAGVALAFSTTDANGIVGEFRNEAAAGGLAGDALGDSFTDVEAFIGTDFADTVGGAAVNFSFALGGGDDLFDTDAADAVDEIVDTGAGNDRIFTGGGNDSLIGAAGNDTMNGEAGADTLIGGAGIDNLTGGAGADVFEFQNLNDVARVALNQTVAASGTAVDIITDFNAIDDQINLAGASFGVQPLSILGFAYDGTNSGIANGDALIFDGTHLIFDDDVNTDGYVAIAEVNGLTAADIITI
ncbi:calcium-binding protein [Minwuia sp.]|uniref:calcium-binding protein n=1 Tax=Minwuia sp. TaxID=2493630 RepID=UPI003A939DAD